MSDEEGVPDPFSLLGLGGGPEVVGGDVEMPEGFTDEVMVDEEIVDTPEQERTEGGIVEMGMDIVDGRVHHDAVDGLGKGEESHGREFRGRGRSGARLGWAEGGEERVVGDCGWWRFDQ